MDTRFEIRQILLKYPDHRKKVTHFLKNNGLKLEEVEYYAGIIRVEDDEIVGGGGFCGNVLKCIALNPDIRNEQLGTSLVSHLISTAFYKGYTSVKLFTSPKNQKGFEAMGFKLLASSPDAVLMENGGGILNWYHDLLKNPRQGRVGIIVINANPFTFGHLFLVEQAAKQVDTLFVMVVKEDVSEFSFDDRYDMIYDALEKMPNVTVIDSNGYIISKSTFPTYFLKEETDATATQIALDLDLFVRHVVPALNIEVRFVGSEPSDSLTRRYNEAMKQVLPRFGVEVVEIERLRKNGSPISASNVRKALDHADLLAAIALTPYTTWPYLLSNLATKALLQELNTTPKPGLVDCHDSGAHQDMDYEKMHRSIMALHPSFTTFCLDGFQQCLPSIELVRMVGQKAEHNMLYATGGVNTHKGAVFSMGLTLVAAAHFCFKYVYRLGAYGSFLEKEQREKIISECIAEMARKLPAPTGTHGAEVQGKYKIGGALANAQSGYVQLFADWLPFYRSLHGELYANHKLLLHIMSSIDDTNVFYRHNAETAAWLKQEAAAILQDFSIEKIESLNKTCIERHISPGGSADMLALTILMKSICG